MASNLTRAEIIVGGVVQGVGFRYFVLRCATVLGLKGYVKNLPSGEVLTLVEGEKGLIIELYEQLKVGSSFSRVTKHAINWYSFQNEFTSFEIRH